MRPAMSASSEKDTKRRAAHVLPYALNRNNNGFDQHVFFIATYMTALPHGYQHSTIWFQSDDNRCLSPHIQT